MDNPPPSSILSGASSLSTSPASISSLLPELLTFIFYLIPPKPRIFVVSLVCRRWRRIAIEATTSWPLLTSTPDAMRLLRGLTEAHVGFVPDDVSLPALRSLAVSPLLRHELPFTNLTALTVTNDSPMSSFGCKHILALLHRNSATLLRLSMRGVSIPECISALTGLTCLDLRMEAPVNDTGIKLLAAHSSQLQELSLIVDGQPPASLWLGAPPEPYLAALLALRFPRLRTLLIGGTAEHCFASLTSLAPPGCTVSIEYALPSSVVANNPLGPLITSFLVTSLAASQLSALLRMCPRLRHLVIDTYVLGVSSAPVDDEGLHQLSRLTDLSICDSGLPLLHYATSLQTLTVYITQSRVSPGSDILLPRLTRLRLDNVDIDPARVQSWLACAPQLTRLALSAVAWRVGSEAEDAVAVLLAAQQHGVQRVLVGYELFAKIPRSARAEKLPWVDVGYYE